MRYWMIVCAVLAMVLGSPAAFGDGGGSSGGGGSGVSPGGTGNLTSGCQNQQKHCHCDATCENCCTRGRDITIPSNEKCPDGYTQVGSTIINMNMTWIGEGTDYETSAPAGCPSCGGAVSGAGKLPALRIMRYHRYRNLYQPSSFGPGVFLNYDVTLSLHKAPVGSAILVNDPAASSSMVLFDDYSGSSNGIYEDAAGSAVEGLRLYDASDNIVVDQALAVKGVLTAWSGEKYVFEIFRLSSDPATANRFGRLSKVLDRNGNAITVEHAFAYDADDATLGFDRMNLWKISSVTDAYGRMATFTYRATPVGGQWAIERVDLPNGTHVDYTYQNPADDTGLVGLAAVDHADGTQSTFSTTPDVANQTTILHYFDATERPTHRRKDVHFSNWSWVDPNTQAVLSQAGDLVRKVVNGAGEMTYWNSTSFDASTGVSVSYVYAGGNSLFRLTTRFWGAPDKLEQAIGWDPNQDVSTYEYELVKSYTTSGFAFGRTLSETDNLGQKRTYAVNLTTGSILKTTFEDGTFETTQRNGFQQPTHVVDRLGRVTNYVYDPKGNLLSKTAAVGTPEQATWSWTYNGRGQPLTVVDANGNVTDYLYTPEGYLASVKEPPDNPGDPRATTLYAYDGAGRLTQVTDPRGRVTQFAYDGRNRVTATTYEDGTSEVNVYGTGPDANIKLETTDRLGNVEKCSFDLAGRKTLCIKAFGKPEAVSETFSYLAGTESVATTTAHGEKTDLAYDAHNRLVATTSQASTTSLLTSSLVYDTNRRIDQAIDRYGRKTFFVYDVNTRVVRLVRETAPGGVTLPLAPGDPGYQQARDAYLSGLVRTPAPNAAYLIEDTQYDAEGQVTARVNGRGISTTYAYDHQGRQTKVTEAVATPAEAVTQHAYDAQGNRVLVVNPRGFATAYAYTGRNLLASVTMAFGTAAAAIESYEYELDRKRRRKIDGRGNSWTTVWSECCGYHEAEIDPSADLDGAPGTPDTSTVRADIRDSMNHVTHEFVAADASAFPGDASYADPAVTVKEVTTRYDGVYRPVARTVWLVELGAVDRNHPPIAGDPGFPAASGLTTRWVYDDDLTDGVGLDVTYAAQLVGLGLGPGSDGTAVEETNPAGEKSVTVYDGIRRTIKTIDGNGNTTRETYDALVAGTPGAPGALVEMGHVDGLGHVTTTREDGAGRVLATADALGFFTVFSHDATNNRISHRDPNGVGQDCAFDERNRQTKCVDTQGDTTERVYDGNGNTIVLKDGFGHEVNQVFDPRDRRTSVIDRLGGVTDFAYDENSNLLSVRDADANARGEAQPTATFGYDARNFMTSEAFREEMPSEVLAADDTRRYVYDAAGRITSRLDQAGVITTYAYDRAHRLFKRGYSDGLDDTFTYDGAARMLSAVSARYVNTVRRWYDPGGRLVKERLQLEGANYDVSYGYDAANRQTSMTYPHGAVVERSFTSRNQIQQVKYAGSAVASFAYDPGTRRTSTTFGNGLVETRTYRPDNLVSSISTPGVTSLSYPWDANKRKTTEHDSILPGNLQSFAYDHEDRLTSFSRSSGQTQTWDLSLAGDWNTFHDGAATESRSHDAGHELTKIGAMPLPYDAKGNLLAKPNGQTYTWDFENRMASAHAGATMAAYSYDALGRRVLRIVDNQPRVFVSAGMQEIAEYGPGATPATPARAYVHGSYVDEILMMVHPPSGTRTYYHTNQLYSVTALTNQVGAVVERYRYDPYGAVTILAPDGVTPKSASAASNPWMFTGRRLDRETGLLYYRTRYYDSTLGRFLSRDPIGYTDSLNRYEYVRGIPTIMVDPSGMIGCVEVSRAQVSSAPRWTPFQVGWFFARYSTGFNGTMTLEDCPKCCPTGVCVRDQKVSVVGSYDIKVAGGVGVAIDKTVGGFGVTGYAGIQLEAALSGDLTGSLAVDKCNGGPLSLELCGGGTLSATLSGGINVTIYLGFFTWSAGGEVLGNWTGRCEACFTCSLPALTCTTKEAKACSSKGFRWGFRFCFGPCYTVYMN